MYGRAGQFIICIHMSKGTFLQNLSLSIALCLANSLVQVHGQSHATNQRLSDTIPFIPDYGKSRLTLLNAEPVTMGRTIFVGNSITEMGDWKTLTGDSTVLNRGISGDITFSLLLRLPEVIRHQPARIFLLIGINDIGKDIPDAVIVENIMKIAGNIRSGSPSTKLYIQSILPLNPDIPGFPQHYDKQGHVLNTNVLLQAACKARGIEFLNIHDLFTDSKGKLDQQYTSDGLHLDPKGTGYQKWVAYLKSGKYL